MKHRLNILTLALALAGTLNAQNGKWEVYDTRSSDICGNNISAIAADAKGVWAGTYQGLWDAIDKYNRDT